MRPTRTADAMDVLVGSVLLGGVLASLAFLVAGVVWHRVATGEPRLDYALAGTTVVGFVHDDVAQLLRGELRPRLSVNVGLAILMLTPYVRVVASFVYFAFAERDGAYAAFTGFVLAVLTYSLFG